MNPTPQIPVAVFLTAFEPGGTERQMTELIRRLASQRSRVHVACFSRDGAWSDVLSRCSFERMVGAFSELSDHELRARTSVPARAAQAGI